MQKLFELDTVHVILTGCEARIEYTVQTRCTPMQLRMRLDTARRFRINRIIAFTDILTLDDEMSAPKPETGFVHVGFKQLNRHGSDEHVPLLAVGMSLTVEATNIAFEGVFNDVPFFAEVWGIDDSELRRPNRLAGPAWRRYSAGGGGELSLDVEEAFRSGFSAGRKLS